MTDAASVGAFVTSIVRWALVIRVVSLVLVLLVPVGRSDEPRVVVAVALLAGWTLLFLGTRRGSLDVLRRHPILALADVLVTLAVTGLVGVDSPLVFATLSTALVTGVLLPVPAVALVTLVLVCGFVLLSLEQSSAALFAYTMVLPATYVVLALLGAVTRRLHEQVLTEQTRRVAYETDAAAAAERARLARDMHDSVAKSLHGVALAAAALPRWIERDRAVAAAHAVAIQQAAEQASVEARDLLVSLRTTDDGPLVERLTRAAREAADRIGVDVEVRASDVVDLCHRTSDEVVLVVSEALENVVRHAHARHLALHVTSRGGRVTVTLADDGRGFDPDALPPRRFGVVGMHERAAALGGTLEVRSRRGEGTTVTLTLPAPRTADRGGLAPSAAHRAPESSEDRS